MSLLTSLCAVVVLGSVDRPVRSLLYDAGITKNARDRCCMVGISLRAYISTSYFFHVACLYREVFATTHVSVG